MQQVTYDLAWQHFDEVNNENDTERLIDLAGLSVLDAEAIVKQKIYDLGQIIRSANTGYFEKKAKSDERILVIVCDEIHL